MNLDQLESVLVKQNQSPFTFIQSHKATLMSWFKNSGATCLVGPPHFLDAGTVTASGCQSHLWCGSCSCCSTPSLTSAGVCIHLTVPLCRKWFVQLGGKEMLLLLQWGRHSCWRHLLGQHHERLVPASRHAWANPNALR